MLNNYTYKNESIGVDSKLKLSFRDDKDIKDIDINQKKEIIYGDLANQEAVKKEIGDVLIIFDRIISESISEVNIRRLDDPIKYRQRGFYSQDLNATIKSRIIKEMGTNPKFRNKIRLKTNRGSYYFIVKDKYILFVKRLYSKLNKPQSYPTLSSEKLFSGTLLVEQDHIPTLFIGPNLNDRENSSFITSLVSRNEVNWTTATKSLFGNESINRFSNLDTNTVDDQRSLLKIKRTDKVKKVI